MYHVETIDIAGKHPLYAYADTYTRYANNMYNVTNYYIRNLMTGLKKETPTPNEASVIRVVQDSIPKINAALLRKHETKAANIRADMSLTDKERAAKLKKAKCAVFEMPTAAKWFAGYNLLDAVFKYNNDPDYRAGHSHVMQNAVSDCCEAWSGYFESLKRYSQTSGHTGKPKIPGYRKSGGHRTAVFSNIACRIRDGWLIFPGLKTKGTASASEKGPGRAKKGPAPKIRVRDLKGSLIEVRIVPYCGRYQVQVVTDDGIGIEDLLPKAEDIEGAGVMCLDPGLDNFASIADNKGNTPFVIKGGAIKARNQWYNKETARLRSELMKGHDPKTYHPPVTKQMHRLSRKRDAFLRDTFYKMSHFICREAAKRGISFIIVGHNEGQKQRINMGHTNNQSFAGIPYTRFNAILETVAVNYGIRVILQEESYTSKASFGDRDSIPVYGEEGADKAAFSGRRIKRGLYRDSTGRVMNADINGACNIGRKYNACVFGDVKDTDYLYRTVIPVTYSRLNRTDVFPATRDSGCSVHPVSEL